MDTELMDPILDAPASNLTCLAADFAVLASPSDADRDIITTRSPSHAPGALRAGWHSPPTTHGLARLEENG
jgi:hypothetical protein